MGEKRGVNRMAPQRKTPMRMYDREDCGITKGISRGKRLPACEGGQREDGLHEEAAGGGGRGGEKKGTKIGKRSLLTGR